MSFKAIALLGAALLSGLVAASTQAQTTATEVNVRCIGAAITTAGEGKSKKSETHWEFKADTSDLYMLGMDGVYFHMGPPVGEEGTTKVIERNYELGDRFIKLEYDREYMFLTLPLRESTEWVFDRNQGTFNHTKMTRRTDKPDSPTSFYTVEGTCEPVDTRIRKF